MPRKPAVKRKPRACAECAKRDAVIAVLKGLVGSRAEVDLGAPSVMAQMAEQAEAETEDSAMRRHGTAVAAMQMREGFHRVHMRSPYADCKVTNGEA
jgi:hypothetical protein